MTSIQTQFRSVTLSRIEEFYLKITLRNYFTCMAIMAIKPGHTKFALIMTSEYVGSNLILIFMGLHTEIIILFILFNFCTTLPFIDQQIKTNFSMFWELTQMFGLLCSAVV